MKLNTFFGVELRTGCLVAVPIFTALALLKLFTAVYIQSTDPAATSLAVLYGTAI